jgi:hypothetical protein
MSTPLLVYLVVRRTQNPGETGYLNREQVPVRAFATRPAAEVCCAELEADVRRQFDLPELFSGEDWENDEVAQFAAVVAKLGLPPCSGHVYWWHKEHFRGPNRLRLTAEQRQALWEAAPASCRIFQVIESTLED